MKIKGKFSLSYISAALLLASGALTHAATVTMTAGNAAGTSGFNSATGWSNGLAPSAENDYVASISGSNLRTPLGTAAYVFAGNSLTITNSATFLYKGDGSTITVSNLALNGASILHGSNTNSSVFTLAGAIALSGTNVISAQNGGIILNSNLSGSSGTLTIQTNSNNTAPLTFNGTSTYTGNITFTTGASTNPITLSSTSSLKFAIGAAGVNNSISGAGTITLNGAFVFDLTAAVPTQGATWTISTLTAATYGANFSVSSSAGTWSNVGGVWTSPGGGYSYSQATGVLTSAVPEPSTYAAGICGVLAALIFVRRRRLQRGA